MGCNALISDTLHDKVVFDLLKSRTFESMDV